MVSIGFNATLLSGQAGYRRSGIARYLDRLLQAMPAAVGDDNLVVYAGRGVSPNPQALDSHWRNAALPFDRAPVRIAWEHLALPFTARRDRLDLFHGTVNVIPRLLSCPTVVTIHDLAFLRWPEQVPARRYRYLSTEIRSSVKRAARIIAVSEATKCDIVELLQVDPNCISVTPLAVDASFRPASDDAVNGLRKQQRLDRPFILAVGNLEPRKNVPTLLRSFAKFIDEIPHDLVLIGGEGWLSGEIHQTLANLHLGDRVRMTGFVSDDDLPTWYSAADLFVYPSLYEGFGLPILEAMACGTPVITANTSSMPEVAGDDALLIDPNDDNALTAAITRLLNDRSLADDLGKRGLIRAAGFTWSKTAAQTVQVYRQVTGGKL